MTANRELAASGTSWAQDDDGTWVGGPGLLRSLWRYRLVVVAVVAVCAVVGFAVSLVLPARYEAKAALFLRDPGSPAALTLDVSQPAQGDQAVFVATQAALVGSDDVFERALQILGRGGTPAELRSSVEVAPAPELTSVTITGVSGRAAEAADLANAVGVAYQQVAAERTAGDADAAIRHLQEVIAPRNAELDSLRARAAQATDTERAALERQALHVADLIGALQVHQNDLAAQAALYRSGVESFQEAAPPTSSSRPAPLLVAVVAGLVGLIVAGGWAWWAAGRDRRVEAEDEAGAVLGVPLLGETPRLGRKLRAVDGSRSPGELDPLAAEAYHFVLTSLEHALSRLGGKVVAVASAAQGDGKTVTVLNLALAARREGLRVRLVDADERTRRLSWLCGDDETFDLVALGRERDESRAVVATTPQPARNGSGGRNGHHPALFFHSSAFGDLVSLSAEPADIVLIDTPALLDVSETVKIADHADAVLLVVDRGTPVSDLRRARERLAFTDTPLIGYLLNRGASRRAYGHGGARSRDTGRR